MIFPQQEDFYKNLNKILDIFDRSEGGIRPHFHITGPSGTGKSYLVQQAAKEKQIPFLEVNAASITAEGLSGNSLSKALKKLREHWNEPNIIFVDEFDKLFQKSGETTEGFRSSVQDEFLTALENKYVSVFGEYGKYDQVVVENSLFIFAGAYSNQKITTLGELKEAGLCNEFLGRVPLVLSTQEIPLEELSKHVSKLDLYKKYQALFQSDVKKDVRSIIGMMKQQESSYQIGIRLINSAIHQHFIGTNFYGTE